MMNPTDTTISATERDREHLEAARAVGLAALDIARALLNGTRMDDPFLRNSLREFHVGLGMALAELEITSSTPDDASVR